MSFETITIYRDLQIINKYVQVPPNAETDKTRVLATDAENSVVGSAIVGLSMGSNRQYGSKCGRQEFLRLPGITPNSWYTTDPSDL